MSAATPLFVPGLDDVDDVYADDVDINGDARAAGWGGPIAPPPAASPHGPAPRARHLRAVPVADGWSTSSVSTPVSRAASAALVRRSGSVSVLLAPELERPPLRLTRRGAVAIALLVAVLGVALVWVAALSASANSTVTGATGSTAGVVATRVVTVRSGDTLWSIAGRVAPNTDPRAEVDRLRSLNHLDGVALVPGQQLRVR